MPWARASGATRALNCPASVYLPRIERPSGPAAEWGTAVHTAKEGRDPGRRDVRDWVTLHELFWPRTSLWPGGHHERGLGLHVDEWYQVDKAWEGPAEERWDLDSSWMTGAADWWTDESPVIWVDDLKTGRAVEPPPTDQLTFYGTALARQLNTKSDVMTTITHWPRYPRGKGPVRLAALVTYDDRRLYEERIAAAKNAADLRLGPNPGPWCQYCECTTCPFNGA